MALLRLTLIAIAALQISSALAEDRQVLNPFGTSPPYSPGVKANGIIYVAGQIAPEAGSDFKAQTDAVLKKVQAVVEAAGSTMARVDKCNVYLTQQAQFEPMNEIWRKYFPSNPPVRSTIVVAALTRDANLVEIDCVAH